MPSFIDSISGALLALALFNAVIATCIHVAALLHVSIFGRPDDTSAQWTSLPILCVSVAYWYALYAALGDQLNLSNTFLEQPWSKTIFDNHWPWVLIADAVALLLLLWFRIGCTLDSQQHIPSQKEVIEFYQKYEVEKGLRDVVVVLRLTGKERKEMVMECIQGVISSKFPSHRIRIMAAFSGLTISKLDHELRKELGKVEEDIEMANAFSNSDDLVVSGVRITFCRFASDDLRFAAFKVISERYHLQQRKPLLLFLHSNVIIDEFALASFSYEMHDPKRDALTGIVRPVGYSAIDLVSTPYTCERQIMENTTEDYTGNVTYLPSAFTMIRFKAFKKMISRYNDTRSNARSRFEQARVCIGADRFLSFLVGAHRRRHRIGLCSSAKCSMTKPTPPSPRPPLDLLRTTILSHSDELFAKVTNDVHRLCSLKQWTNTPLQNLMNLASMTVQTHTWIWVHMSVLERINGRGTDFGLAFCLLMLLPFYLVVVAYGDNKLGQGLRDFYRYPLIACLQLVLKPVVFVVSVGRVLRATPLHGPVATEASMLSRTA